MRGTSTPGPWQTDGSVIWNNPAGPAVAATRFPTLACHHCRYELPLQLKMPNGGTLSPVENVLEAYANAQLIAAAPVMLETLKHVLLSYQNTARDHPNNPHVLTVIQVLEKVIAKAEGRA